MKKNIPIVGLIHKFSIAKSFPCWLGLLPNNKISGGKLIGNRMLSGKNHIAKVLRQAANFIGNRRSH
ncbi:transposase [Dyadobacter sp. LHD-138]|uniref:transposase n=1 Tax=Dyadobacter sp. LHD-138 TaxID=3071413 RepID=UPI0038D38DFC